MTPDKPHPTQDPLDNVDPARLPELQNLSAYCPFSLNAKICPHESKCLLKRICFILCPFRLSGEYCDGVHHVFAICEQYLTDKGCRYNKEEDHPFVMRSHDVEFRAALSGMLRFHELGLYGVRHF